MFTLIITAVLAFHGSSVNVHSIDFENKQACEIAAKEWKSRANHLRVLRLDL